MPQPEESDDLSKPTAPSRPSRWPGPLPTGVAVAVAIAVAIALGLGTAMALVQRTKASRMAAVAAAAAAKVPPPPLVPLPVPLASNGVAIADPALREARANVDALLGGLLAGRFDDRPDLRPIAGKLKGYQAWSIQSQRMAREGTAEFTGFVTGPAGRARFAATVVKQASGNWEIATFSGPDRE